MDQLPLELLMAVCELLETEVIAKLRLVSKYCCQIATPFLLSDIHLIFKPESFDRIVAISEHPVISQYIVSILYEPYMLDAMDRDKWEKSLMSSDYKASLPTYLPPDATDEEAADFYRRVEEYRDRPKHSYTKKQMEKGWMHYQQYYNEQQSLVRQRYFIREIGEVMTRMPKIRSFRMSTGNGLIVRSDYLKNSFRDGLHDLCDDDQLGHSMGVPQLRSMILSMYNAGIKLRVFECGEISWKLFRCSKGDLQAFAGALSEARKVRLLLTTASNDSRDRMGTDLPECRRFLKNGRVRELLSQAPDIEDLELRFDWYDPYFPIELANVVGDHIWPNLTSVTLSTIETSGDELMHFLQRHRTTLRKLCMGTICLRSGEWPSTVPQLRCMLKLEELLLEGWLYSDVPRRAFEFGFYLEGDERIAEEVPRLERRKALQDWFKVGGDCPLRNEWSSI